MDKIIAYAPSLLQGAGITLALALVSVVLATLLGLLGAWAKISGGAVGRSIAGIYTVFIRGVPDLVLILLFYFGGQRLVNAVMGMLGAGYTEVSPFVAGVGSIGLIYGAYLTETFRGAWTALPKGQLDAAKALGLPSVVAFRKVYYPQLLRAVLAGFSNVWQVLVKATAVVSVIGLNDLVGRADKIGKSVREPFLFLFVVLVFYLLLTIVSQNGFRWIERRTDRWAA